MIPLIQADVVGNGWMELGQFIDFIAVSESTPGPFAVNIATFVGSEMGGIVGQLLLLSVWSFLHFSLFYSSPIFCELSEEFLCSFRFAGIASVIVGLVSSAAFTIGIANFLPDLSSFSATFSHINYRGLIILR